MISHGTLNSLDLQASRRFYEEVLGFEVMQVSPVSMQIRKGTHHTYVVVETREPGRMGLLDHNGIDVASREDVDAAYRVLVAVKDAYGIQRINRPQEQHGAYSFYFADPDGNWWEILNGRPGGYSSLYDDPSRDLTGRTDIALEDLNHSYDDGYADTLRESGAE
ncbi:VOC family protein [Mycobacterium sp. 3519A]|uniref:VOC family protein n=1 Tax=Mycobacterium sp. 3519A TaxID=2057184 RepID=UPI001F40772A|nr:VOC family protein [Mycobacterium sp. 3519A]